MAGRKRTVLLNTARELRALSTAHKNGEMIGRESELMDRLAVSRPTLRQAAAMLKQEQLLTVKQGVKGGFYASRPTSTAVAHMAAIFLQVHGVTPVEIVHAIEPSRVGLARLAARNATPENAKLLRRFLEEERAFDEGRIKERDYNSAEREFNRLLCELGGNRLLTLFSEILTDFAIMVNAHEEVWIHQPERVRQYRNVRNRMIEAILDRDEAIAVLVAQRCSHDITEWMIDSLSRSVSGEHPADLGYAATFAGTQNTRALSN